MSPGQRIDKDVPKVVKKDVENRTQRDPTHWGHIGLLMAGSPERVGLDRLVIIDWLSSRRSHRWLFPARAGCLFTFESLVNPLDDKRSLIGGSICMDSEGV